MLYEFKDIIDPTMLPRRRKYLYYYIVGLVDGEGCFSIAIKKQDDAKFGWVVDPVFYVSQSVEKRQILEVLKRVFNCGRIIPKQGQEDTVLQYVVDARRNLLEKILPFFKKHKLIIKHKEFEGFAEIVEELERGRHRNIDGLKELIRKTYSLSSYHKYTLDDIFFEIDRRVGASETIRRAP